MAESKSVDVRPDSPDSSRETAILSTSFPALSNNEAVQMAERVLLFHNNERKLAIETIANRQKQTSGAELIFWRAIGSAIKKKPRKSPTPPPPKAAISPPQPKMTMLEQPVNMTV